LSLLVFSLVTLSALLHVLWNALVKTCHDKTSFAWLTSMVGSLVLLPVFVLSRCSQPGVLGGRVWVLAAASGFFESLYILFLLSAYRRADLSVVYPLSRGVAPLVAMALGGLFVGDTVSAAGVAAVCVIALGVGTVGSSAMGDQARGNRRTGILFALATGCMIACYHLVDRGAMRLDPTPSPVEYLFLMHLFLALFVTLWVFFGFRYGRRTFVEWSTNRKGVVIVGVFTPLAYFLIIFALKFGNAAYVAAGRNIGIFISIMFGFLILKERVTSSRLVGSVCIAAGLAGLVLSN
jgi:drug/metabolite transporter (DMT)-like permease